MSEPAELSWQPLALSGWGRTRRVESPTCRPHDPTQVQRAVEACREQTVIAYGGGRSYGDAALNGRGRTIATAALTRIEAFDPASGSLVCESGVTFGQLLDRFLPAGWLAPVVPGTAFTTLGGAIANDIHGKNHESAGSFGAHVEWLELVLPSGERRKVSAATDPELFAATLGGIGLTGLIVRLGFRLRRVPSASVEVEERRIGDLDAFMAAFEACRASVTHSVGWIDLLGRGRRLGRGILETAEPAPDPAPARPRRQRTLRFECPDWLLNPASVRLFNELYWRRIPKAGRRRIVPIDRFLHPLDAIGDWNRMYGRRGFYQFQCVVPDRTAGAALLALVETAARSGRGSFLAVLKTLGAGGRGLLSFPTRGYTLALDFPRHDGIEALFARLEALTVKHEGRVYLAKDALLSAEGFRAMYPQHGRFQEIVGRVDPGGRLSSDMARRLGLKRR